MNISHLLEKITIYSGLDTKAYPVLSESKLTSWKVKKVKLKQNTCPMWEVNFGLCWKVTFMLKRLQ